MLGYTRDEILNVSWVEITHPDDVEPSQRIVDELIAGTGRKAATFEKRYIDKHGKVVWGSVSTAVVRDATGQPARLITHVQNITRRKRADERIAHLNRVLQALHDIDQLIGRENDPERMLAGAAALLAERGAMPASWRSSRTSRATRSRTWASGWRAPASKKSKTT